MKETKDPDLYVGIQRGDQQALEQLYDRYEKILFSFAYRITKDQESAEEVVQEIFIKIWKGQNKFDPQKGKFSTWAFTIARNISIDLLRKQKDATYELQERDALQRDAASSTEDSVIWRERGKQVREAIATLAVEQQNIIEWFYFKGATQREIAKQFNLPLGTVKGRIRLALRHLREALSEEGGEGDGE